jgi:hypothetical protein
MISINLTVSRPTAPAEHLWLPGVSVAKNQHHPAAIGGFSPHRQKHPTQPGLAPERALGIYC